MTEDTARSELLAEVASWERTVTKWEAEGVASLAELENLRSRMGEEALSDPDAAEAVPRKIRELGDRVEMSRQASAAAEPRLRSARAAVLEHDAAAFDAEAAECRRRLAEHDAKTAKLLKSLERHEGTYVPVIHLVAAGGGVEEGFPVVWPKSDELRNAVAVAEARAAILRDQAAGVDPSIRLRGLASLSDGSVFGLSAAELYPPALWGPDAVVPATVYVREVDHALAALDDHDLRAAVNDDDEKVAELEAAIDAIQVHQRRRSLTEDELERIGNMRAEINRVRRDRASMPAERRSLVARVDDLTQPA